MAGTGQGGAAAMSVAASHWVWTQSQAKGSDRLTLLAIGDGDGFPQFPQGDSSTGGTVQQPDGPVRDPSGGPDSTPLYEPRTVSNHARARARGDNPGRPQRLSPEVAVPGYSHADNAGHDPDPGDCAACGTAGSHRPASRATRRAALEAAGPTPSDWPDGHAVPPPGDPEA